MKIAFIGQIDSLHFYRRTAWYVERGHRVLIISYDVETGFDYGNAAVERVPRHLSKNPLLVLHWVKERIEAFQPDVIHIHKCDYPGYLGLFLNYHPLVATLWDGTVVRDPRISHAEKKLVELLAEKADLFTTNSPGLLQETIAKGIPEEKTCLTSWGVDYNLFNPDRERSASGLNRLKARYGIGEKDIVVFCPRVIVNFSNIDIIIRAIDKVNEAYTRPVKFLVAGYQIRSDALASFAHILSKCKHKKNFIWCGKITDQTDLALHHCLSHIYLSLYSGYLESSPASMIEAMLCGAVPAAAYLPVLEFWIEDGKNGFFLRHRDVENVANKIIRAVQLRENSPGVIRYNYKKAVRQANFPKTMEMMEDFYHRLREKIQPGFKTPEKSRMIYQKGIYLELMGWKKEASLFYRAAYKIKNIKAYNQSASGCMKEFLFPRQYVNPLALKAFKDGGRDLPAQPPPSGDIREYAWAAGASGKDGCKRARHWLQRLAERFHYHLSYLESVFLEKYDLETDREKIYRYLEKYKPFSFLSIPRYYAMAVDLENRRKYDAAVFYFKYILEIWKDVEPVLRDNLLPIKKNAANALYHLGIINHLYLENQTRGNCYLKEALKMEPHHGMAKEFLEIANAIED